jgi:hypothetical protein
MRMPIIIKQAYDVQDMSYDSKHNRLKQNRAWTNRDRGYIDNTIDDDATNIEFALDQDNDDIMLESPRFFKNKPELLAYLDKEYEKGRGSQGNASWDYAPKPEDREYVNKVLGKGDRNAERQIKYEARLAAAPAGLTGALLGGIIPAIASKRPGFKGPLLGATVGGLGTHGAVDALIRKILTRQRITNRPKNYDEYMASQAPQKTAAPIVYMKSAGYKEIERLRRKGRHKPKPFMHGGAASSGAAQGEASSGGTS